MLVRVCAVVAVLLAAQVAGRSRAMHGAVGGRAIRCFPGGCTSEVPTFLVLDSHREPRPVVADGLGPRWSASPRPVAAP